MHLLNGRSSQRQFDRFTDEVTDRLVRTGYLMTWDLGETEDLVQETLLRVARHWDRVSSMAHPAAYARRILVNLVIDGDQQRRRRNAELDSGDGVEDRADLGASGPAMALESASAFRAALGALPARQRAVIVLRYWEDLPETEVAELLGCSLGTVKSSASRGLGRLREVMGSPEGPAGRFGSSDTNSQTQERTPSSC